MEVCCNQLKIGYFKLIFYIILPGGFYFENINEVSFRNVTIENGLAFYGVGVCIVLSLLTSIFIIS